MRDKSQRPCAEIRSSAAETDSQALDVVEAPDPFAPLTSLPSYIDDINRLGEAMDQQKKKKKGGSLKEIASNNAQTA